MIEIRCIPRLQRVEINFRNSLDNPVIICNLDAGVAFEMVVRHLRKNAVVYCCMAAHNPLYCAIHEACRIAEVFATNSIHKRGITAAWQLEFCVSSGDACPILCVLRRDAGICTTAVGNSNHGGLVSFNAEGNFQRRCRGIDLPEIFIQYFNVNVVGTCRQFQV